MLCHISSKPSEHQDRFSMGLSVGWWHNHRIHIFGKKYYGLSAILGNIENRKEIWDETAAFYAHKLHRCWFSSVCCFMLYANYWRKCRGPSKGLQSMPKCLQLNRETNYKYIAFPNKSTCLWIVRGKILQTTGNRVLLWKFRRGEINTD